MNRNLLTFITLFALSLVAASCANAPAGSNANAPASAANANSNAATEGQTAKNLPEDVLQANVDKVELAAGKTAEARVRLIIKEGYHINANPPSQYQIATQLTVPETEGIKAGQISYPPSITKKFAFSEQPLAVYEKEAIIKVPLTAAANAAKGAHTIPARLRYQACDEQVCYPKREMAVGIPVTVE